MIHQLRVLALAALAAAAAWCGSAPLAGAASAIYDVDGAGRNPYEVFAAFGCSARASQCELAFAPVPTGKRLVVQHVSCGWTLFKGAATVQAAIVSAQHPHIIDYLPFQQTSSAANLVWYVASFQTTMIYGPGDHPLLSIYSTANAGGTTYNSGNCTLTGYYVVL